MNLHSHLHPSVVRRKNYIQLNNNCEMILAILPKKYNTNTNAFSDAVCTSQYRLVNQWIPILDTTNQRGGHTIKNSIILTMSSRRIEMKTKCNRIIPAPTRTHTRHSHTLTHSHTHSHGHGHGHREEEMSMSVQDDYDHDESLHGTVDYYSHNTREQRLVRKFPP